MAENPPASAADARSAGSITVLGRFPGVGDVSSLHILVWKIPWTESLAGYSSWDHKESDTTEHLIALGHSTQLSSVTYSKICLLFEGNNSWVLIMLSNIYHFFPLLFSFVSISNFMLLIYGFIIGYGVTLTIYKKPQNSSQIQNGRSQTQNDCA